MTVLKPLTTQLIASYAKPEWLVNRQRCFRLDGSAWRVSPPYLKAAKQDAALLAIYEQEKAGIDLLTDGDAQRAAYDRHFYSRFKGIDSKNLGRIVRDNEIDSISETAPEKMDEANWVRTYGPRIVGEISWPGPLSVDEFLFARAQTNKPFKTTVVGPLTAYAKLVDEFYHDEEAAVMALAGALNRELLALQAAGADVLQIKEPSFNSNFSRAKRLGVAAMERVTAGLNLPVIVHVCYGYAFFRSSKSPRANYGEVLELLASCDGVTGISLEYEQPGHQAELLRHCGSKHILLGLLNLGSDEAETPGHIANRLRQALEVVPPERLHPAPDCGMWHLPRELAFKKISALVDGTRMVRREAGLL